MKKMLALVLALALCMSGAALASGSVESTPENTLIVAASAMNGDFVDGFGSNTFDNYIKVMLHGYCDTFEVTDAGEYVINPQVVKDYETSEDEAGNKTYTFTLCDDVKWSDGTPITAKDYVGSLLWKASPKWLEAGASSTVGLGLLGYDEYLAGETDVFAGVKLIDDYTFSCTIAADELPYFYEYKYVAIPPMSMAVYAPDAEIVSTDEGSSFAADYDLLAAMQAVAQKERFAPTIGCGPYKFISFENNTATLEINEHFKGDLDGDKPAIQYVVQRVVPQDIDVDQVIAGEADLVTSVTEGAKIDAAKASDRVYTHNYFRNGYGMIAFACDWGPTADPNVRWALAYLLDRSAIVDYALGGYGGTVDAEYGFAQWMYQEAGADLEAELEGFTLNVDAANERLDQTEWKYEADGTTPFDPEKAIADDSYMRYNADGEMLTIRHMGTDGVAVTDAIEIQLAANAHLAGINFEMTKGDFTALLDNYYYGFEKGDDRLYNSFNLSMDFAAAYDPYTLSWHSDKCGTWENACQLADDELDTCIENMLAVEPGDNDAFIDCWIQYEKRWQELMPMIPLFSNEYYDIASNSVEGLCTTPFATYAEVVCKLSKNVEAE